MVCVTMKFKDKFGSQRSDIVISRAKRRHPARISHLNNNWKFSALGNMKQIWNETRNLFRDLSVRGQSNPAPHQRGTQRAKRVKWAFKHGAQRIGGQLIRSKPRNRRRAKVRMDEQVKCSWAHYSQILTLLRFNKRNAPDPAWAHITPIFTGC